jgi:predicted ATPase
MLTRLKVSGFKNLVGLDVRFGAFTCIAGGNGIGKSNLFDAIRFLSALADRPLMEAAALVRGESEGRGRDLRGLFHHVGDHYADRMTFEAEMIVPRQAVDDLGQEAVAKGTFLRYTLTLGWRGDDEDGLPLRVISESLDYVTHTKSDIPKHLLFPWEKNWYDSAIIQTQRGRKAPFISTDGERILRHQERSGQPQPFLAQTLPRTVLSSVNASESPTALVARREMGSWRLLQLEPSAMRQSDDLHAPARITSSGAHLPATLARLARLDPDTVYRRVANHLMRLVDEVRHVRVDRDEKYELLTLMVRGADDTWHPARALSDGTLRFLALAIMLHDPEVKGVICLEEPENGIHPERIGAMIAMLTEIAVDTEETISTDDNPLRQVIVNTHSPPFVQQVAEDDVLMAKLDNAADNAGRAFKVLRLTALPETWRGKDRSTPIGDLISYISPTPPAKQSAQRRRRIIDRQDVYDQLMLPFEDEERVRA